MKLTLDVGQSTHPGRVRESNEDNLCVLLPPQLVQDFDALLVVADGMGGHRAGEIASQYVADTLRNLFGSTQYQTWVSFDPHREDYTILVLKEMIERLNDELHQMANRREEWRGMGTTITAALIAADHAFIGHVGDSRAYLFSKSVLSQLTKDHSWVMEQVEQGSLTLEQANSDPRKNQITRAVGSSNLIRVDRIIEPLHPDDVLLLCSDGLTNMVSDAEIIHALQTIPDSQAVCDYLVELANQHGGTDNITLVLARAFAAGDQPATAGRSIPSELAGSFNLHDTQPLGPIEQFKGRGKKNPEPVRISLPPAPQPETRMAVEVNPDDEQVVAEPEAASPAIVSQESGQGTEPSNLVQRNAPTPRLEPTSHLPSSPQKSGFNPIVITIASIIGCALLAAMANGALVYAYSLFSPVQSPDIRLTIAVAVSTLFWTVLGFILFILVKRISTQA